MPSQSNGHRLDEVRPGIDSGQILEHTQLEFPSMSSLRNRLGLDGETLNVSARATVAAVVSLLLARTALRLPEFYWAPVSTIVIILSTTEPLTLAWQRFVG